MGCVCSVECAHTYIVCTGHVQCTVWVCVLVASVHGVYSLEPRPIWPFYKWQNGSGFETMGCMCMQCGHAWGLHYVVWGVYMQCTVWVCIVHVGCMCVCTVCMHGVCIVIE